MDISSMIDEIATFWPINPESFELYYDNLHTLYLGELQSGDRVLLRITHTLHRGIAQVEAQAYWHRYCQEQDFVAAEIMMSKKGQAAHRIMRGSRPFVVSVIRFLEGERLSPLTSTLNENLADELGQKIAKLHQLSLAAPLSLFRSFPNLTENTYLSDAALSVFDDKIIKKYHALKARIAVTADEKNTALIHHHLAVDGFIRLAKEDLAFLSFDWLCSGPRVFDVISVLYHLYALDDVKNEALPSLSLLANALIAGYKKHLPLEFNKAQLEDILLYLDIFMLSYYHILSDRKSHLEPQLAPIKASIYQRLLADELAMPELIMMAS